MKKISLSLSLLFATFVMNAMYESVPMDHLIKTLQEENPLKINEPIPELESPLAEFTIKAPADLLCKFNPQTPLACKYLVHEKDLAYFDGEMTKIVEKASEHCSDFPAEVLRCYQFKLLGQPHLSAAYKPLGLSAEKPIKKSLKCDIATLKCSKRDNAFFVNLPTVTMVTPEYIKDPKRWFTSSLDRIQKQRNIIKRLITAQYVKAMLELQELDQTAINFENMLGEINLEKEEADSDNSESDLLSLKDDEATIVKEEQFTPQTNLRGSYNG